MTISLIFPVLFGWFAGWIVNYLSDALPHTRKLSKPECLQCHAPFSLMDYLLFKSCENGHPRGKRVWVVQIAMTALSIFVWLQPPSKLGYLPALLLLLYFGVVFVIDMEHRLILHMTSIVGALLALILGFVMHGWASALLGGLGGFLIMMGFYLLGVLFTRMRNKRLKAQGQEADEEEALGAGDVILVTILGFLVGWPLVWFLILLSILLGGFVSLLLVVGLLVTRKYEKNALMMFIPYGPYFITGAFLIVFIPRFLAYLVPG
jgi:prepilin signal peptidase PulO-like enzyme (type II secretory pathway)